MYSIKKVYRFLAIYMPLMFVGQVVLGVLLNASNITLNLAQNIAISQYLFVLIPALIFILLTKGPLKISLSLYKTKGLNVLMAIGITFLFMPVMFLINVLSQLVATNFLAQQMGDILNMPYVLLIFLTAVTPAIIEELLFRGIILSHSKYLSVLSACLINGLLFGMFHMNLNQFSYAFFLGFLFAYVMHLSGSLWIPIIMHFTVNGFNMTLQVVMSKVYEWMGMSMETLLSETQGALATTDLLISAGLFLGIALFTVPLGILLIYAMAKYNHKPFGFKKRMTSAALLAGTGDGVTSDEPAIQESAFSPLLLVIIGFFVVYVAAFEFIVPMLTL